MRHLLPPFLSCAALLTLGCSGPTIPDEVREGPWTAGAGPLPAFCVEGCLDEDPDSNAVGVFLPGAENQLEHCATPAIDEDEDGLDDNCELALAYEFRPLMSFLIGDEVRREPRWAAEWLGGEAEASFTVRIAYLQSYWMDMGDGGTSMVTCTMFGFTFVTSCHGHAGDSEFIRLDVKYNSSTMHWYVVDAMYSAHTSHVHFDLQADSSLKQVSCSGSPCYMVYPSGKKGHYPQAFAADWKHANYPSDATCDAGGTGNSDDCSTPRTTTRLEVGYDANIGSREYPLIATCVGTARTDHPAYGGSNTECYWGTTPFKGWFTVGSGGSTADPYGPILEDYFGF